MYTTMGRVQYLCRATIYTVAIVGGSIGLAIYGSDADPTDFVAFTALSAAVTVLVLSLHVWFTGRRAPWYLAPLALLALLTNLVALWSVPVYLALAGTAAGAALAGSHAGRLRAHAWEKSPTAAAANREWS